MDAGIGGRARRVLAVLAIALGVLAMHGLAGGHHGQAPELPSLTATAAAADHHAADIADDAGHALLAAGAAAAAGLHNATDGGCHGDCGDQPGMLLLCAAVLFAAFGALALGPTRRTWRAAPATGPPAAARPRRGRPLLLLDPVTDLCVSRT